MSDIQWRDGGQPSLPDPHQDRHVAFPEDDPRPDPAQGGVTGGARPAPPPPSGSPKPRPAPTDSRWRLLKAGGAVVLGLSVLGAMSSGGEITAESGTAEVCVGWCGPQEDGLMGPEGDSGIGPLPLSVTPLSGEGVEQMQQPTAPLSAMPTDPRVVRVEIVGGSGSGAHVIIGNDSGGYEAVVPVPFAAEVALDDATIPMRVTAHASGDATELQCRVYADGDLVSISTGWETAACSPTPAHSAP